MARRGGRQSASLAPRLPTDRWRTAEIVFWGFAIAGFFVFPNHRVLGQPDPDHGTVRAFARSHPRLRGHRVARTRRIFRHRGVCRGHSRDPRLGRAIQRARRCRYRRRPRRIRDELSRRARRRSRAPHGDPRHRLHAVRSRQPDVVAHRRRRWPLRRDDGQSVRAVRVRHDGQHRVPLQPRRAVRAVRRRAPHRELAVRAVVARHPRERAPHASHRRARRPATHR